MEVIVKKPSKIDDKKTRDEKIFVLPKSARFTVTANDVIEFAKEKNILCYVVEKDDKSNIIGWDILKIQNKYIDSHNYENTVEKINKEKYIIIEGEFLDILEYYTYALRIPINTQKSYYVMYRPILGYKKSDNINFSVELPEDKIYLLAYYAYHFTPSDYFNFYYYFAYEETKIKKYIYRSDIAEKRGTAVNNIVNEVDKQL